MRFSLITLTGLAAYAQAQTSSLCDPTKKSGCANNPAISADFTTDFKAGQNAVKGWKQTAGSLKYTSAGAEFTINKKGDSPTIQTDGYLFFGTVEVKVRAAAGQGIISSIVLESDDLDEVDWEFLGTTTDNVQMNYFGKGNTTTYDRMKPGAVSNPQGGVHTYTLSWTSDALTWSIDQKEVRKLSYADAVGGKNFPQTPSNVRIGIWAGGDSDNEKGVIEWAGGATDYTKGPYTMVLESVKITNANPGTAYRYKDQTGDFKSIEVIGAGNKGGDSANSAVIAAPSGGASGGLASVINKPTGSVIASGPAAHSTHCSDEAMMTKPATSVPASTIKPSTTLVTGVKPPTGGNNTHNCDCGVATVTVIGTPPPPPAVTPTIKPFSNSTVIISTPKPATTSFVVPPPVSPPVQPTGGIKSDNAPSPSVPHPTIPSPSVPVAKNTSTPIQFPGAAANVQVSGGLLGLVMGAAMMFV